VLRHGGDDGPGGTVTHHTPPSGPDERTADSDWTPIPDASLDFYLPERREPPGFRPRRRPGPRHGLRQAHGAAGGPIPRTAAGSAEFLRVS
jgi:hypothetical protein